MATATPLSRALPAGDVDWTTRLIVFMPLIATTLLAKFSLPPLGAYGIGISGPLIVAALLFGLITGRLLLVPRRLVLLLVMLSGLGLMQILRSGDFSLTSLLLMAAIGGCYVFACSDERLDAALALRFFGALTLAIAVAGIVQFGAQFVLGQSMAFPIENHVPAQLRTQGFNNVIPLYYGAPINKANGLVMLEPSEFSQLCALGIIAELASRARWWRLSVLSAAMIVSYSGTGFIVLAGSLLLFAILHRSWNLLLPGAAFVGIVVLFAEPLHLGTFLNRLSEFSSPGSSGFARFIGWRELFADQFWPSGSAVLFGHGAGTFYEAALRYSAAEMSYSKIVFEFGMFGALLYFGFLFYCLFSSGAPLVLRFAVALTYFMNGAYTMSVAGLALTLLLWPSPDHRRRQHVPRLMEAPA